MKVTRCISIHVFYRKRETATNDVRMYRNRGGDWIFAVHG